MFIFTNLVNEMVYTELTLNEWKPLAEFYLSSNVKEKKFRKIQEKNKDDGFCQGI